MYKKKWKKIKKCDERTAETAQGESPLPKSQRLTSFLFSRVVFLTPPPTHTHNVRTYIRIYTAWTAAAARRGILEETDELLWRAHGRAGGARSFRSNGLHTYISALCHAQRIYTRIAASIPTASVTQIYVRVYEVDIYTRGFRFHGLTHLDAYTRICRWQCIHTI